MDLLQDIHSLTTKGSSGKFLQHSVESIGETTTQTTQGFHSSDVQILEHIKARFGRANTQANQTDTRLDDLVAFSVSDSLAQVFSADEDVVSAIDYFAHDVRRTTDRFSVVFKVVTASFHKCGIKPRLLLTFYINVTRLVQDVFTQTDSTHGQFLGLLEHEVTSAHDLIMFGFEPTKDRHAYVHNGALDAEDNPGLLEVFYSSYDLAGDINDITFHVCKRSNHRASGFITVHPSLHLCLGNARSYLAFKVNIPGILGNLVTVLCRTISRHRHFFGFTTGRSQDIVISTNNPPFACFVLVLHLSEDGLAQSGSQVSAVSEHILEDLCVSAIPATHSSTVSDTNDC